MSSPYPPHQQPPGQQPGQPFPAQQQWQPSAEPPKERTGGINKLWIILVALLSTAALAVGGVFVVRALVSTPGGADTPEEAVAAFVEAAVELDYAAMLTVTSPNEVHNLVSAVDSLRDELEDRGLVNSDSPTGRVVDGVELQVTGLAMSTSTVHEDVAFVTITAGTLSWSVDSTKLPERLRPDQPFVDQGQVDLVEVLKIGYQNPRSAKIAVVQVDGSWFISPLTTYLELVRLYSGWAEPNWSSTPPMTAGVSDPGRLPTELVNRINNRDLDGVVGLISQEEFPTLAYYVQVAAAELDIYDIAQGDTVVVTDSSTTVEATGDGHALVWIDSLHLKTTSTGGYYNYEYEQTYSLQSMLAESMVQMILPVDRAFLVAVEEDGGWRIAPMETAARYVAAFADSLSDATNAIFELLDLHHLAPVAATHPIGENVTLTVPRGPDFVRVQFTAPAGTCVMVQGQDAFMFDVIGHWQWCETSTAYGIEIPSSGILDVRIFHYDGGSGITGEITSTVLE